MSCHAHCLDANNRAELYQSLSQIDAGMKASPVTEGSMYAKGHTWRRYITTDTRQRGLLSVPAIIGQLTQLFMGSFLVKWLRTLVKDDYED